MGIPSHFNRKEKIQTPQQGVKKKDGKHTNKNNLTSNEFTLLTNFTLFCSKDFFINYIMFYFEFIFVNSSGKQPCNIFILMKKISELWDI